MNKRRTILIIAVLVLLVIAVIIICSLKDRKKKQLLRSASSSDDTKRKIVGGWRKLANLPNLDLASPIPPDDPYAFKLIFDPKLELLKKEIFPLQIKDIILTEAAEKNPDYPFLIEAIRNYPRAPTKEEILFLLKYRKFMDRSDVYSMCGPREIEQMYVILLNVTANKIPGDVVETGVWKGGMSMWMKAVLNYFGQNGKDDWYNQRRLWLFDAFDSFPEPTTHVLGDGNEIQAHAKDRAIHPLTQVMYSKPASAIDVRDNFKKLGLLDDRVSIVVGLFSATLPVAMNSGLVSIAVLRIDNDYYDSVMFVLEALYPLVNKGGFVVIDDYNNPVLGCKDAVHTFRSKYNITSSIIDTYGGSVYWLV